MPRSILFVGATVAALAVTITVLSGRAVQAPVPVATNDAETLAAIVQQTAKAINSYDPDGILAHYSKDILVSYPGVPDTTYDMFEKSYRQMLNGELITSTVPEVQEITVSGDLAYIRMTWSTTITEKASGKSSSRQAKDLQIWRREKDAWKFYRGMWHHLKTGNR